MDTTLDAVRLERPHGGVCHAAARWGRLWQLDQVVGQGRGSLGLRLRRQLLRACELCSVFDLDGGAAGPG